MAYNYNYEIRKDILGLLEKQPNSRFLEIGCGGGDTLSYLKNLGFCSETFGRYAAIVIPEQNDS